MIIQIDFYFAEGLPQFEKKKHLEKVEQNDSKKEFMVYILCTLGKLFTVLRRQSIEIDINGHIQ